MGAGLGRVTASIAAAMIAKRTIASEAVGNSGTGVVEADLTTTVPDIQLWSVQ